MEDDSIEILWCFNWASGVDDLMDDTRIGKLEISLRKFESEAAESTNNQHKDSWTLHGTLLCPFSKWK